MNSSAHDTYLETQVLTAPPQKLRLMLIDAAIRRARQTIEAWDKDRHEDAFEHLTRCRAIITELLGSIKKDDSRLSGTVAGIYVFLFQTLTEAQHRRDRQKLAEVIRVLEIERETWQQVCDRTRQAAANSNSKTEPTNVLSADSFNCSENPSSISRTVFDA